MGGPRPHAADAAYFTHILDRRLPESQRSALQRLLAKAYRWQYVGSGAQSRRFTGVLEAMVSAPQLERIGAALRALDAQAA